jgi:hypothetical protein
LVPNKPKSARVIIAVKLVTPALVHGEPVHNPQNNNDGPADTNPW